MLIYKLNQVKMERKVLLIGFIVVVLIGALASAGFFSNFWGNLTGQATLSLQARSCSETDDGLQKDVAGKVTYQYRNRTPKVYEDKCKWGDQRVIEYYCKDNKKVGRKVYDCDEGCVNGACIVEGKLCTDSDGGTDAYIKGKIDYWFDDPQGLITGWQEASDTCTNGVLTEYSCDYYEEGKFNPSKRVECEYGCVEGQGVCKIPAVIGCDVESPLGIEQTKEFTSGGSKYRVTLDSMNKEGAVFTVNEKTTPELLLANSYTFEDNSKIILKGITYEAWATGVKEVTFCFKVEGGDSEVDYGEIFKIIQSCEVTDNSPQNESISGKKACGLQGKECLMVQKISDNSLGNCNTLLAEPFRQFCCST